MTAKLTAGQRMRLLRDAGESRQFAKECVERMERSAEEAERIVKAGRLTSADRRWLRIHFGTVGSLQFAKL
jgi:hypothetical protein